MTIPVALRRAVGAAVVLLCLAGLAPLEARQAMTLQDAIALARERSHAARAARAAREAGRWRHRSFRSGLLPQLSLAGTIPAYNRSIIPVQQPDGTTLYLPQQQTEAGLTMTVAQKLPLTGGDFFVSSSLARIKVTGEAPYQTWSSTPVAIGLRQPILRPNTAAWDRREDVASDELNERQFLEAMEEVALQAAGAFFDLYAARLALDNASTNAAVNDTLYRLNTGRFEVGRIGENDLLQSELALLRARTALDAARLAHERATEALRLTLNLPPEMVVELAVTGEVPAIEADSAQAVAEALRNTAAVARLELDDVQARRRVTDARLATGAGAVLQGGFGLNGTAAEANLAYQNLLEARRFTLSVQVPLWLWGAHGEGVRAAEADRDRVQSLSQATREQVAHEARFAALELAQARRNLLLVAKSDSVAAKRFEVAYNRYVIGRIAIDNLYIAQAEKDQGILEYVQALRGYWDAHYRLRRATLFDFAAGRPIRG